MIADPTQRPYELIMLHAEWIIIMHATTVINAGKRKEERRRLPGMEGVAVVTGLVWGWWRHWWLTVGLELLPTRRDGFNCWKKKLVVKREKFTVAAFVADEKMSWWRRLSCWCSRWCWGGGKARGERDW